jgi:hypothetical protein
MKMETEEIEYASIELVSIREVDYNELVRDSDKLAVQQLCTTILGVMVIMLLAYIFVK